MTKLAGIPRSTILAGISILLFVVASSIGAVIVSGMSGDPERQATLAAGISAPVSTNTLAAFTFTPQVADPASTPVSSLVADNACALIWGIQPPVSLPQWLKTPTESAGLKIGDQVLPPGRQVDLCRDCFSRRMCRRRPDHIGDGVDMRNGKSILPGDRMAEPVRPGDLFGCPRE